MDSIVVILDEAYAARERVGRDELYRRAVAADASRTYWTRSTPSPKASTPTTK